MCMWKQKERNGRRATEIEGGGKDREREKSNIAKC